VEMVREEVRHVEVLRAAEVVALAEELEISPDVSLRQLAAALGEPWRSIFVDHRRALLGSIREIGALAAVSRDRMEEGAAAAREALGWLEDADEKAAALGSGEAHTR